MVTRDLFADPEELKAVMLKKYNLKEELVDTILNSKINLTTVSIFFSIFTVLR
mgnify:CR=1 FL=1